MRWTTFGSDGVSYTYASVHMPYRQAQLVAAQKTSEGARGVAVIPVF